MARQTSRNAFEVLSETEFVPLTDRIPRQIPSDHFHPCHELRFRVDAGRMAKRFQKCFLRDFFRRPMVLRDVHRKPVRQAVEVSVNLFLQGYIQREKLLVQ
nr:hypothetical protein [Paenibacillus thermoaerophilus]